MNKAVRIINIVLSVLFAVAVYIFWAMPYRAVLSYHEQFQLFLFGGDYLQEHLSWPGGFVTYVAEFLVQFFNNYWIGAVVVTIALVSIQLLTWRITCGYKRGLSSLRYVVSFLPAVAMWMLMGDVNYLFSYTVAFIAVLAAYWAYTAIKNKHIRLLSLILGIPVIYWLAGTMVYLFAVMAVIDMLIPRGEDKSGTAGTQLRTVLGGLLVLTYTFTLVWISGVWLNHPVSQVLIGINYYRLLVTLTPMMVVVPVVELLTVTACALMRGSVKITPHRSQMLTIAVAVVVCVAGTIGVSRSFDSRIQELTDYDYLIRTNNWREIIRRAELKKPNTPLSLCATNLALGMTDQLQDRALQFDQHGVTGLIPTFQRDANSSLITAEIYYQLGLVNSAQRLTFEAMEAITNYNKSSRCIKRLVETNMIRGDYGVAEKYLKLLDRTMMYSKWAQRMRQLIDTPGAIDRHPVYGKLRKRQLDAPFLFSETEIDKIMGQLVLHDPENTLAIQYLLMYPLMQRDLDKFMQYLEAVQKVSPYYRPTICQQAVAMAYVNAGIELPQGMIDAPVMHQFGDFARIMTSEGKDSPSLDRFKNTIWYYLVK